MVNPDNRVGNAIPDIGPDLDNRIPRTPEEWVMLVETCRILKLALEARNKVEAAEKSVGKITPEQDEENRKFLLSCGYSPDEVDQLAMAGPAREAAEWREAHDAMLRSRYIGG